MIDVCLAVLIEAAPLRPASRKPEPTLPRGKIYRAGFAAIGGNVRVSNLSPLIEARPVAQQFNEMASRWERETRNMSSLADIKAHPSYRAVVALGQPAVRLILERMRTRPGFWFEALRELTKDSEPNDPVLPSMYGDLRAMTDAWLKWGAARGYVNGASQVSDRRRGAIL